MSEKSLEELEFEETGVTRKERWKVMWASIVGYAMDGLDVLILSFAMAAIVAEFGLTLGEGGLIATYTLSLADISSVSLLITSVVCIPLH